MSTCMTDTERLDFLSADASGGVAGRLLSLLPLVNNGMPLRDAIDQCAGADAAFYAERERELAAAREEARGPVAYAYEKDMKPSPEDPTLLVGSTKRVPQELLDEARRRELAEDDGA